ncbi:DoxX family protein [Xylophilus sp. GW821-FHT01B05]
MTATVHSPSTHPPKVLRASLWGAQFVLAGLFLFSAFMKLATPFPELARMMPWTGELPQTFVRFIGLVDLAGGLGILLPSLTRVLPRLTVLAALGCTVLQVFAIVFHVSRGEAPMIVLNIPMLALALFVLWGRARKAPVLPR